MTVSVRRLLALSVASGAFGAVAAFGTLGAAHAQAPAPAAAASAPVAAAPAAPAAPVRPDPAKGQALTAVCAACHAPDGNSVIPQNPKLAGQPVEYLVKQLADFTKPAADKSAREAPIMMPFAMQLSPEDRKHVSAWYASQKPSPGAARNKETADLAQRIYRVGIPEKNLPACAGCHGPTGAGLPALYPRLAGQHPEYLEAQLKAFRDGTRRNNESMTVIASRLSDAEMKALADFMAGLAAARPGG